MKDSEDFNESFECLKKIQDHQKAPDLFIKN